MLRSKATLGFAALAVVATVVLYQREVNRLEARLARERTEWAAEKQELEELLANAQARSAVVLPRPVEPRETTLTPREILERLQRLSPDDQLTRNLQLAVYWLEELTRCGPSALPALQDFLATGRDLDLDVGWLERGRGWRDRLPGDFVAPPSLRLGLFDVARKIGGEAGEQVLALMQATTPRGIELAYLTRVLHELAPDRYREPALVAARQLLSDRSQPRLTDPLDRYHHDNLLTVLAFYGDRSYVAQAQAQLVGEDAIDRPALAYLSRTLGLQAVKVAAQAYEDPRLKDAGKKAPLARVALAHVPDDPDALALWQKAIDDPAFPRGARSNLIEDLNEVGFPTPGHLTTQDLPLIESRIALIERLAPTTTDPVNTAAFKEALKDLLDERRKLLGTASAPARQ